MNFAACCEILNLNHEKLGFNPDQLEDCSVEHLEKDLTFFIKHHYRKQALKTHPDKGGSQTAFKSLVVAYETAMGIIEETITRKKNAGRFPSDEKSSIKPQRNTHEMSFNELITYLNKTNPWILQTIWDDLNTEITDFVDKAQVLNLRMEREYQEKEEKVFQSAYEAYLNRSAHYYQRYQNSEYLKYTQQFERDKTAARSKIIEQSQPALARAARLINLGLALFFLAGLPLLFSLYQWVKKRKLIAARDRELSSIDQRTSPPQTEWQLQPDSHKPQDQWEQTVRYQTTLKFKEHYQDTDEGPTAEASLKPVKTALISRQFSNRRIADSVQGMNLSLEAGEDLIYYSLFRECKAMEAKPASRAQLSIFTLPATLGPSTTQPPSQIQLRQ